MIKNYLLYYNLPTIYNLANQQKKKKTYKKCLWLKQQQFVIFFLLYNIISMLKNVMKSNFNKS